MPPSLPPLPRVGPWDMSEPPAPAAVAPSDSDPTLTPVGPGRARRRVRGDRGGGSRGFHSVLGLPCLLLDFSLL